MHSDAAAITRCSKFGNVIHVSNNSNSPIPVIDERVIFGGELLEDLDDMMHEISISESIASSPSTITQLDDDDDDDDETNKPRASRHLEIYILNESSDETLVKIQAERLGLRERLESYLDVEHANQGSGSKDGDTCDKENVQDVATKEAKHKRFRSPQSKSIRRGKKAKKDMYLPVVWVIQPDHNKDGTICFKFTTDAGAFLVLKDEEALASLDIMKASSRSITYFQVYSLQGSSSRVMKPDRVAQAVNEIIAEAKPVSQERDLVTYGANSPRNGLRRRLYRFLLRRRWQRVVRRQIRIALGDTRECSGFASLASPFAKFWGRVRGGKQKSKI